MAPVTAGPGSSQASAKTALVLAGAGESRRLLGVDKVFATLGGHPLLYWPLRAAQDCRAIDRIVVLLSARHVEQGSSMVRQYGFSKVTDVCAGGERRQDSVRIGLGRLAGRERGGIP